MIGYIKNTKIDGILTVVPSYVENIDKFESILGKRKLARHKMVTGIHQRHLCKTEQNAVDMAIVAARNILEKIDWDKGDINYIVYVTQHSPLKTPSSAFFIQNMLGLNKECLVFDVNMGCTGNNVGMQIISSLLNQYGDGAKGLLIYSDAMHTMTNEDFSSDLLLFGAAATVMAVSYSETANYIPYMTKSDGARYKTISRYYLGDLNMDGEAVFNFGINEVAPDLKKFMQYFEIEDKDVDFYSIHQAQKMMLDMMIEIAEINPEKEYRSIEEYGNTSGASVIANLCANTNNLPNKDTVKGILCGFGIGLSWSVQYITIKKDRIFSIIESDDHYEI